MPPLPSANPVAETPAAPPAEALPETFFFPASSAQQRLWFLEQFQPGRALYNIPIAVRLTGPLDAALLARSLNHLVRRHEILRTSFAVQQEQPVQIVALELTLTLPVTDLRSVPEAAREARACSLAREEARRPFDLRTAPLLRVHLLHLSDTDHIFLLTVHHIVFDGWSLTLFFHELAATYTALGAGRPPPLPELPVQYGDFAAWQHERLRQQSDHLAWWTERLAGSPPALELPADRPRPAVQGYHGRVETLALPATVRAPLEALSRREGVTVFMILLAAFQALLHRHTGQTDLLVGTPVAGRNRPESEALIGLFINTLVLRGDLSGNPTFRELLGRVRTTVLDALAHEEAAFEKLVEKLPLARSLGRAPLFQTMFVHERAPLEPVRWPGLTLTQLELDTGTSKFDLTLYLGESAQGFTARAEYDSDLFEPATIRRLLGHFAVLLEGAVAAPDQRLAELPLLTDGERRQLLVDWNNTAADFPRDQTIHGLIAAQTARTPQATAVVCDEQALTYQELDRRATGLAGFLRTLGVGPGALVGICVERSLAMMVGLLGILKAGGAYLPLDPKFPAERLAFIVGDARVQVVLTQGKFRHLLPAADVRLVSLDESDPAPFPAPTAPEAAPTDPAYVLYTSGSTGKPKGVVVTHRNVVNFFAGMNRALGCEDPAHAADAPPGCWLAVTTISFDISVLELLWTLTRGFKVIIHSDDTARPGTAPVAKKMDFSLFYFSSEADKTEDRHDKYRLLMEGAKFGDRHGFSAVWTPERHFHAFGGLFPNPSVTGAALAVITSHIGIRAGSVVLPLHNPIRVAEEWAVVDNLSHGRAGVAFASGWHNRDFVLAPQNFNRRKQVVEENIAVVRQLWRGEPFHAPSGGNGDVIVTAHPRPVQAELPIWITASGDQETFRLAGALGANLITHLLGQSYPELAEKIRLYRAARQEHGHAPDQGTVTLMLHTFVGPDLAQVRETVRAPLCTYLKLSADLVRTLAGLPAASGSDPAADDELAAHIDAAFDRYFENYGLFGTPESCLSRIERLQAIGVDEVACLIDFGIGTETVLAGLEHLNRLKTLAEERTRAAAAAPRRTVPEQITHHHVTHLQCTPSLAKTLVADPGSLAALRQLHQLLIGGEPMPVPLAAQLHHELPGRVRNMYGPTETTVWSTTHRLDRIGSFIPLGRPIANTRIYVLDGRLQPVPVGVPGELFIGGESVATGYLHRPELTAEKFLPDPFAPEPGARMYRTGDLARYRASGDLEFLGRLDHQAKIRGHRVELGEIETVLQQFPGVRECVAVTRPDAAGDQQLIAYLTAATAPVIDELRHFLTGKLPDYMVPATYVVLARLPLTPNGKVNRSALPEPDTARPALATTFAAPRPGLEQTLAAIWSAVLNIANPGAEDNFFDLGGHSLRVAQVHARLQTQLARELPMIALFQYPTIRSLARHLGAPADDGALRRHATERAQRQRTGTRRRPSVPTPVTS